MRSGFVVAQVLFCVRHFFGQLCRVLGGGDYKGTRIHFFVSQGGKFLQNLLVSLRFALKRAKKKAYGVWSVGLSHCRIIIMQYVLLFSSCH